MYRRKEKQRTFVNIELVLLLFVKCQVNESILEIMGSQPEQDIPKSRKKGLLPK